DLDAASTPVAKLYLKTASTSENKIGFAANGVSDYWGGVATYGYVYLNLGTAAGTKTITISRTGANVTVYIDSIEFVTYNDDYDFASGDSLPGGISWRHAGASAPSLVSDTGTTDGYALKATHNAGNNFLFNITDITVSAYAHVIMRVKIDNANLYVYIKNSSTSISLNNNGLSATGTYIDIDIAAVARASSWTDIVSLETWSNGVASNLYIDSIYAYKTDLDYLNARNNYNNVYNPTVSGGTKNIVEDPNATDGYAVQIQTGTTTWQHCRLYFIGGEYSYTNNVAIKVRMKMTGAVGSIYPEKNATVISAYKPKTVAINSSYFDYYIFPTADCNDIDFSNGGTNTNITYTIDYIQFISLDEMYSYNSDTARLSSPNGTIVADANASDGYALKIVKNSGNNAYYYLGRTFTVADYEHIYVTIRFNGSAMDGVYVRNATTPNASAGSGEGITASVGTSDYTTIDLVQLLTKIDAFNQIDIWDQGSHVLYIDSIVFVPKS
ncbi:MAG: hypothetical protein IJS67_01095, partial [Clostridia bacterium]|nr:hypothetical protein [Clostridia bacterium]